MPVHLRKGGRLVVDECGVEDGDGVAVEAGWPERERFLHLFRLPSASVLCGMFRGLWAGGAQTPGYGLGPADVQRIQKQMVGLPITIEHEGLVHSAPKVNCVLQPPPHDPAPRIGAESIPRRECRKSLRVACAVGASRAKPCFACAQGIAFP